MLHKLWCFRFFYFWGAFVFCMRAHSFAIGDHLRWNTFVELESSSFVYDDKSDEAGLELGTLQSGWSFESTYFSAYLYGHYREGVTDGVEPSQAQLFLNPFSSVFLGVGRAYLSFGYLESYAASDTPAAGIGYTLKDNVQLGWFGDNLYAVVYAYESDVELLDREKNSGNFGVDISYTHTSQHFSSGLSYLSNMADSDLFGLIFTKNFSLQYAVPMTAAHAKVYWNRFQLYAEQLTATKPFSEGELFGYLSEKKPSFNNVELIYFLSNTSWLVAGHRTTADADFTGLPQAATVLGFTAVFYGGGARWMLEFQQGATYPQYNEDEDTFNKNHFTGVTVKTEFSF